MSAKTLIVGVVAGVVLFVWGFVSHMLLPLGEMGFDRIEPDKETALLNAMSANLPESSMCILPGYDNTLTGDALNQELEAWSKKYEAGPTAFLVFNTTGQPPIGVKQLGVQALCDILTGICVALLMFYLGHHANFVCRISMVVMVGFIVFLETDMAQWNWYGFSMVYTGAQLADRLVGMLLVGLIAAIFIRPKSESTKV